MPNNTGIAVGASPLIDLAFSQTAAAEPDPPEEPTLDLADVTVRHRQQKTR